jgi:5-methylcytosine-specific restriction endonuclease McrA
MTDEQTELLREIALRLRHIDGVLTDLTGAMMSGFIVAANQYKQTHNATRRKAPGKHTRQEWQELKARYEYKCLRCHRQEPEITLTKDHIKPVSKGGTNDISNIQPLCANCAQEKGDQELDYR